MDEPVESAATSHVPRWLLVAAASGLVARFALATISVGSNDATKWEGFARAILESGLVATYRSDASFNHPPLMGLLAAAVAALTNLTGARFTFWFKVPGMLAEIGTTTLLFSIVSRRAGARAGAWAALLYAWNPSTLVVSGYHGNTDCIYPFFALLAAYLATERGRPVAAGLALAAAVNVKLIPVLLLPAMLLPYRSSRDAGRFAAGFGIGVLPFAVAFACVGRPFVANVLAYNSQLDNWGILFFLLQSFRNPWLARGAHLFADGYLVVARYLILATVAWVCWKHRTRTRYELSALTLALFLVLAPGFGIQYVVSVVAFLVVVEPTTALAFSSLAGLMATLLYVTYLRSGALPLYSEFTPYLPVPGPLFGLLAWFVLVQFLFRRLAGSASRVEPPPRDS